MWVPLPLTMILLSLIFIITGEGQSDASAYMIVDKCVIDTVEMVELPFALMAAFFVYNICYLRGCSNFYFMLEILVFK